MGECLKFLGDRIRKIYGLGADVELTEDWLREALDEVDLRSTAINCGGRLGGWKRGRKRLFTHDEAVARLRGIRSADL